MFFYDIKSLNSCFNCTNSLVIMLLIFHDEMHKVKTDYRISLVHLFLINLGPRGPCSELCGLQKPVMVLLWLCFSFGAQSLMRPSCSAQIKMVFLLSTFQNIFQGFSEHSKLPNPCPFGLKLTSRANLNVVFGSIFLRADLTANA